jgi:hypothetical protein
MPSSGERDGFAAIRDSELANNVTKVEINGTFCKP